MRPATKEVALGTGEDTVTTHHDGGTGEPESLAIGRFAGYELYDPLGRLIGQVSRVFVEGGGSLAYVEVALGFLDRRTVLVPVEGCEVDEARRTLVLKRVRRA